MRISKYCSSLNEFLLFRHPKSVEVANEVVATDSPPHFVHLFETRRPSEDSIHPVSALPKSVTSRRGSNDAIDVKQLQTSEAQPIRCLIQIDIMFIFQD